MYPKLMTVAKIAPRVHPLWKPEKASCENDKRHLIAICQDLLLFTLLVQKALSDVFFTHDKSLSELYKLINVEFEFWILGFW